MIDFHNHLDLYPDPSSVLQSAIDRQCYILAVTTTPLAWEGTCHLVGDAPRVRVAAGLHPELVAARHREVDRLCELLNETPYVGEIGLDGSKPHRDSLPLQGRVLEKILSACEAAGGRIMSIHSRGAAALVLDHLERHVSAGTPVLHWFSGTLAELARAIELGCWFSVGPAMLSGKNGRRLAAAMPPDRVLTETDGPFTRRGNDAYMPWHVDEAVGGLASLWALSREGAQQRILTNLRSLIDTSGHDGVGGQQSIKESQTSRSR